MITHAQNGTLLYTYKLDKGISQVKGGINILTELNYPDEIIQKAISNSLVN
jgi:DNA mismatch repair ATPase MutS